MFSVINSISLIGLTFCSLISNTYAASFIKFSEVLHQTISIKTELDNRLIFTNFTSKKVTTCILNREIKKIHFSVQDSSFKMEHTPNSFNIATPSKNCAYNQLVVELVPPQSNNIEVIVECTHIDIADDRKVGDLSLPTAVSSDLVKIIDRYRSPSVSPCISAVEISGRRFSTSLTVIPPGCTSPELTTFSLDGSSDTSVAKTRTTSGSHPGSKIGIVDSGSRIGTVERKNSKGGELIPSSSSSSDWVFIVPVSEPPQTTVIN